MTKLEIDLANIHLLSDEVRITTEQLAMLLQLEPNTLEILRCRKRGIPYEKIGGAGRYKLGTVREYLKQHTYQTIPG